MTAPGPGAPDPRDVDAEFARMLAGEGMRLAPGVAPHEPAAPHHPHDRPADDAPGSAWPSSGGSPPEPPSEEDRERARAAHPSAGGTRPRGPGSPARPEAAPAGGPEDGDEDDLVLPGDFEPPDPDLPTPAAGTLWAWTALIGGVLLTLVVAVSSLPLWMGALGGLAALGGVLALLLRAPRSRSDDGAEV